MGDFGDGLANPGDKKDSIDPALEQDDPIEENAGQDGNNARAAGPKTAVSPIKWLTETFAPENKDKDPVKQNEIALNQKVLDMLPLMLDGLVFQGAGRDKSYSLVVNLDNEVERKLHNAPADVQAFYKEMRTAQLEHRSVGLDLIRTLNPADAATYKEKYAEMNAWLAFPEDDKDCAEGRTATKDYLKRVLDRNGQNPANDDEQKKDYALLARIYSLHLNDHDYLHNEDELTRRNAMHHLPDKFVGIGADGKAKEFNLKALAEAHMADIMQGSFKSPLKPDERANLAFYSQVLRQVLPQELLEDANKAKRDAILSQYVSLYSARDMDLSKAGQAVWQVGVETANAQYPGVGRILTGVKLTDAENLFAFFTLTDVRQLAIEGHEMRTLAGRLGKPSELAYPDQERLNEFSRIKAPMREHREGQVLAGRRFLDGVFEAQSVKEYVQMPRFGKEDLRLGQWQATPKDWQLVYWADNPKSRESQIQSEAHRRFPRSLQCGFSNEGADLLRRWMGPDGLFGDEGDRLSELAESLRDARTKRPCAHDSEPRKKGKIN